MLEHLYSTYKNAVREAIISKKFFVLSIRTLFNTWEDLPRDGDMSE